MPGRYSRLSQRQEDPKVRKELERRSKESIDYGDSIQTLQNKVDNIKPTPTTTVTSKDQSIDIVKDKNNYDLSVYRYIGGYETYRTTTFAPDTPEVEGCEKLPVNVGISPNIDNGWIPFLGEEEVFENVGGCFQHTGSKLYSGVHSRDFIYFKAPKDGVYRFEIGVFITLTSRNEEHVSFCWPAGYATDNHKINIENAILILAKYTQTELDVVHPLQPLQKVVCLVDRDHRRIKYETYKESFDKSNRYTELHRTVSLKLYEGDIIVPFYRLETSTYVYTVIDNTYDEISLPIDDDGNEETFICQQLEYFYAQWCRKQDLVTDTKAQPELLNIIKYYD